MHHVKTKNVDMYTAKRVQPNQGSNLNTQQQPLENSFERIMNPANHNNFNVSIRKKADPIGKIGSNLLNSQEINLSHNPESLEGFIEE